MTSAERRKDSVIELAERTAAQLTSKKQGPG